jgi:hypothetical protein
LHRNLSVLCLAALVSLCSIAQPQGETLPVNAPDGYKVVTQIRKGQIATVEMLPAAESLDTWTEMLTMQTFFGLKAATPSKFRELMETQWKKSCNVSESYKVAETVERGYPIAVWYLSCDRNVQSGKPELTWFKAVQGNDSFYVVQKAFRFEPTNEQMKPWIEYLRDIRLCDTRIPSQACPRLDPVKQ